MPKVTIPLAGRSRARTYRTEIPHPLTGRPRWTLTAPTYGELADRVHAARAVGATVLAGRMTLEAGFAALDRVRRGLPAASTALLVDAWRAYESTLANPVTAKKAGAIYRRMVAPTFGADTWCAELSDAALATWVADLERRGYAPKTIRAGWALLAAALRHARRAHLIERLPFVDFRAPRAQVLRPRAACTTLAELEALAAAAAELDARRATWRPLGDLSRRLLVVALLGLRNGEAAALGWDHVDLRAGVVTVVHTARDDWRAREPERTRPDFPTKGRSVHRQKLHPTALELLAAQRVELERLGWYRSDGPVFPDVLTGAWRPNNSVIDYREMRRVVELARARGLAVPAGVLCVHALRHSMVSLELAHGAAPRALQRRIGHASLEQLDAYAHDGAALPASAIPPLARTTPSSPSSPKKGRTA